MERKRLAVHIADQYRQNVKLNLGATVSIDIEKAAGFHHIGSHPIGAKEHPLRSVRQRREAAVLAEQADRRPRAAVDANLEMVMVVLTDAGQVMHDLDANLGQMCGITDARLQQYFWLPIPPAHSATSREALNDTEAPPPLGTHSTPVARRSWNSTRDTVSSVRTSRLPRASAGRRKKRAVLPRSP